VTVDEVEWVVLAARSAETKTDADIVVLEVGEVLAITNWFVIASGQNLRQVRTIAEEVERVVAEAGGPRPQRVEGLDTLQWVLLDYGEFVVHVFHEDARRFYDLERLWGDVPRVAWREAAQQP
jgi:ribosome-associated protein